MPDPRSTEGRILHSLRRITRSLELHSRELHQKIGLTASQLTLLRIVSRGNQVTSGDLARQLHLGSPTVTGILDRLESRGLIVRRRGHHDRRSVIIELTEEASGLLAEAPSAMQETFEANVQQLEEWERTQILATLQRVANLMDPGGSVSDLNPTGPASGTPNDQAGEQRDRDAATESTTPAAPSRARRKRRKPGRSSASSPSSSPTENPSTHAAEMSDRRLVDKPSSD